MAGGQLATRCIITIISIHCPICYCDWGHAGGRGCHALCQGWEVFSFDKTPTELLATGPWAPAHILTYTGHQDCTDKVEEFDETTIAQEKEKSADFSQKY